MRTQIEKAKIVGKLLLLIIAIGAIGGIIFLSLLATQSIQDAVDEEKRQIQIEENAITPDKKKVDQIPEQNILDISPEE